MEDEGGGGGGGLVARLCSSHSISTLLRCSESAEPVALPLMFVNVPSHSQSIAVVSGDGNRGGILRSEYKRS